MKKIHIILAFFLITRFAYAQNELYNNAGTLHMSTNCIVQVNGGLVNKSGSTLTNHGNLTITGNITNEATISTNTGTLHFVGTTAQTLNGTMPYNAKNVVINNAAGVTLNTKLIADGTCTFTNGIVHASASATPMVFTANATVTGAANTKHVNGYVVREGTGAFTYPVGNGTVYQPCGVNLTSNATGMQVKYNATNAGMASFGTTGTSSTPLIAYNSLEHWDISPLSTAEGSVTIYWDANNNVGISNVSDLKVAHKTGGNWLNEGGNGIGTVSSGSVTSNNLSIWSPFTLGSIATSSPLPLEWLDVSTSLSSEKQAVINWKVQEKDVAIYQVEKSNDSRVFTNIATLNSKGNGENSYQFTEQSPIGELNYFRIKQIDANGNFSYSRIVTLANHDKKAISVYPNPAKTIVTVNHGTLGNTIMLTDLQGKILETKEITSSTFMLDMSNYQSGVYFLNTNDGQSQKIIKE